MNITPTGRAASPSSGVEQLLKEQNRKLTDIYDVLARIAATLEERR